MRAPLPKPEPKQKKKPKPLKRSYIKRSQKTLKRSTKPIKVNKQPERQPSILPEYKEGYIFEPHEIFFGRQNRLICFEHGLWVWLSHEDHYQAHNDRDYDLKLKQECQQRFEETHTRQEWMNIIGRNYLD